MITIYSTPTCVYCRKAKEFFEEKHIEFVYKDVTASEENMTELVGKVESITGFPIIDFNGQMLNGFNPKKMEELLSQEK